MRPPLLLTVISSGVLAAANSLPRGVSPEDANLYLSSTETFTCITHPSITIPISRVNDDYCDCPDGSDEPGTSACANLPPQSLGIPGFYCDNAGHTPSFLPLSRVNDGVCDYDLCCDGSDEYLNVSDSKCENRCGEIGAAARKMAERRRKHRSRGMKGKEALLKKAVVMRREIEENIARVKTQIEGQEVKVGRLKEALKETEKSEREKIVVNPKPGRKVDVVVQVVRERVEELRGLLRKVLEQRDEAERKLAIAEGILKAFREEYNPNFNDEGVKRAVRAWEEYLAGGNAAREKNEDEERDLKEVVENPGINWEELAGPEEEENAASAIYQLEQYLPESARKWIHEKLEDLRQILVDNGVLSPLKTDDVNESPAVAKARTALNSAESDLSTSRNKLRDLENDLTGDYYTADVFRPLKGTCVDREFGEYRYEYCFLDNASQISLKDSGRTSLGGFSRFETRDETSRNAAAGVFASGWEEEHHEPLSGLVLVHERGQQCWNGPQRSAAVQLYCSAENELRSVVEAEKCVYKFEVGTPAVCEVYPEGKKKTEKNDGHVEL
ncbi:hypothetical protein EX30DRAFT_357174 [Ascodesmis nigricans]|uniref:Glucosidase 2 subunit beta n=1 Tax=Ascodesmis nigricans TaxID=341454 RepID=A0A4S2N7X5_9PEZI|nr:hypothetical protein EX30DRAFT_357174 [Ascodesmis nigricans]